MTTKDKLQQLLQCVDGEKCKELTKRNTELI